MGFTLFGGKGMISFLRRKRRDFNGKSKSSGLLWHGEESQRFFSDFAKVLLPFLKDFSLDAKELKTEEFRRVIGVLAEKIKPGKKIKDVRSFFEKNIEMMRLFIKRQNLYLVAKETEFKEMIDLLTRAMANVSVDNEHFSEKMLEQSGKIEQAATLNDMKEMKRALKNVVEELRKKVQEKQFKDSQQIMILSKKVKALSAELEKAEKGTLRDGLTGIYNFGTLEKYIRKVVEKNVVENAPFSMLALDIDEFDKIIETYGDKLSDRVVLAIADKCRDFLKTGDFAARYKGGVFVMILPGESLKKAAKRAKRFCKTISKSKYTLDDMQSEHVLSFRISVGITAYKKGDTVGTVTRRALEALDSAKNAGGNRVETKKP